MSKLDAALYWAARGFRVFPISAGTKDKPTVSHTREATTDETTIRAWWTDPLSGLPRDHNIGISTTGFVVVDLDNKAGKQGTANYLSIGGMIDTLTVRTPSGGLHLYYRGPDSATVQGFLGKQSGVDIRSHGGYVVAAGSYTQASERSVEGGYEVINDIPMADVPVCVATRLRRPLTRDNAAVSDLDETPGMVAAAMDFLTKAMPAIQGEGGDQQTYQTACRLRDLGVSERGALALMLMYWNDRCIPPWDADELGAKVDNAYRYATGAAGSMSAEVSFARVEVPPVPPPAPPAPPDTSVFQFGNATEPNSLPPRPWLYTRFLMRQHITLLTAAGAAGKSTLSLQTAAHLAMGVDFMGYKLKDAGPKSSIIYDHEDDTVEMSRRLWAICHQFGFPFDQVRGRIALLSRKELSLKLTEGNPPRMNENHVRALGAVAAQPDVALVGLNPLVSLHTVNEDDNIAMTYVMEVLHALAEFADVAILLAHHTSKSNGAISRAGDPYAARGAGAIVNSARLSFTMGSPTKDECDLVGIPADKRYEYVRVDDAKMQFALQSSKAAWLKKTTVKLPAGDEVGVFVPHDMQAATDAVELQWAATIAAEMKGKARASATLNEAADMLRAGDPLMAKLPPTVLRARVKTALANVRHTPEGAIRVIAEMKDGRLVPTVVLE